MPGVKRDAVFLHHGRVEGGLPVVDDLRDEVAHGQEGCGVEVVQQGIGGRVAVVEGGVGQRVVGRRQVDPLADVAVGDVGVVGVVLGVAGAVGDLGHGGDADDALEGQVRLITATKVRDVDVFIPEM